MAGDVGPFAAHVILVGSWVAPPAMLLGGGIAAGWPFGIIGASMGTVITGCLFAGPPNPIYRSGLCAALASMAMAAEKGQRELALAAAGGVAILTALLHVTWVRNEHFFHLITKTLRGRDYYAAAEVRGALDQVRPGKDFFAVHPHGCLSAGWTWNVSFLDLPTSFQIVWKRYVPQSHSHAPIAHVHTHKFAVLFVH